MMVDKETWRDVDGYEGLYKVSSLGNLSTTRRQGTTGKPLKPILENTGYFSVRLCKYGHTKKYYVHRLVAAAFLGFYPLMQVNHKNEVRNDNRISNLEWVTPKNNCNYGNHNSRMAATNRGGKKWVIQYDLKGNKINCYKILHDAARAVGGNAINISRAARGTRNRKTAYGYVWRYE